MKLKVIVVPASSVVLIKLAIEVARVLLGVGNSLRNIKRYHSENINLYKQWFAMLLRAYFLDEEGLLS